MKVSRFSLVIISALVWYIGGTILLIKAGSLIKSAHSLNSQSIWTFTAVFIGLLAGLIKGRYLFSRSCKKNLSRIRALAHPRPWQCFRPGFLVFLAIIMAMGALMSKTAAGNFTLLLMVGTLDLSIAFALLTSSLVFWRLKAFSASGA